MWLLYECLETDEIRLLSSMSTFLFSKTAAIWTTFTLLLVFTFWVICYKRLHVDMFSSYVMIEFYTGILIRNGS